MGDAPLAQLHITVRIAEAGAPSVNRRALERELDATLVTWRDRLRLALRACHDEAAAAALDRRYAHAFPAAYQQDVAPALAVQDIADLGTRRCHGCRPAAAAAARAAAGQSHAHLRLLRHREPLPISDALPILESFGLRVIAERPYELRPGEGGAVWIQDFELETPGLHEADAHALEAQLNIAYTAVLAGALDSDGFHRLIVSAGLTVAQTRVLRACCRYLLQTGIPFSQAYMERVLHSAFAHRARPVAAVRATPESRGHRPAIGAREAAAIERRLYHAISEVRNPDDDRILRGFLTLILAIARTNYFCTHTPRPSARL